MYLNRIVKKHYFYFYFCCFGSIYLENISKTKWHIKTACGGRFSITNIDFHLQGAAVQAFIWHLSQQPDSWCGSAVLITLGTGSFNRTAIFNFFCSLARKLQIIIKPRAKFLYVYDILILSFENDQKNIFLKNWGSWKKG